MTHRLQAGATRTRSQEDRLTGDLLRRTSVILHEDVHLESQERLGGKSGRALAEPAIWATS